jgi:hypothetical protein
MIFFSISATGGEITGEPGEAEIDLETEDISLSAMAISVTSSNAISLLRPQAEKISRTIPIQVILYIISGFRIYFMDYTKLKKYE